MKKPLLIWVSALTLLAVSATLFAQTTTGSSLITEMKAGVRAFTLTADLNPGATGLQSAPVSGKKTGDMLTAGEYNRILELVGQGGGGGGGGSVKFHQANIPVSAGSVDLDSLLPSGYIAAFITSCWPSSNMDGLQIAYNTAVTTAWPNASCGAIMASPGVHIFGGGTWFKITGYLASGGGGGGGGTAGGTTEKQIVRIARNWWWTWVSSHLQSISGSSAWEVRTAAWDERCVADGYANGGWIIDMDSTAQVGFCAR